MIDRDLELVRILAAWAQLPVTDADLSKLAAALREHRKMLEQLPLLDLTEADPEITFDPRWER